MPGPVISTATTSAAGTSSGSGPTLSFAPSSGPTIATATTTPTTAAKSGGGGPFGFLHEVGHYIASKSELAARDIKAIPGGVVQVFGAAGSIVRHPLRSTPGGWHGLARQWEHPLRPVKGEDSAATLGRGILTGTKDAVVHPTRDPFQTLLTVLPAAGAAGRVGEAGAAVRAGEFTDATKALSPFHPRPPVRQRLLSVGDTHIPLHASTNPSVRLVQAGYDALIQHALDTNPEGRIAAHATRRASGSLQETSRYQHRMQAVPANLIERGGVKLGPRKFSPVRVVTDRVPRKVQEAALRLVSENNTAEEAMAYHVGQARAGVARNDNLKLARLYKTVAARGLIVKDEAGDAVINGEQFPKLAALDKQIAEGQSEVDLIAEKHGLATPEQLASRRNGPARIRAGATYETPTAAKMGKPSKALLGQRARVERLQTLHDRATEQIQGTEIKPGEALVGSKIVGPGAEKASTAESAVTQSAVRLAELERQHAAALDKMAAGEFGPINRADVNARTKNNLRAARQDAGVTKTGKASGASTYKSTKRPTVKQERRAAAEQLAEEFIAKEPTHPVSVAWRKRTAEIDKLKALQNPDLFEKPKGIVASPGRVVGAPGSARAEKLGAALSVAKDRLEQMEAAAFGYTDKKGVVHSGRVKPTGIVGGDTARPGRGFVTHRTQEPKAPKSAAASSPGPVVGAVKSFIPKKSFTGKGIQHGHVPDNTSRLVAQHMRAAYRYVNTDKFRARLLQTSHPTRRTSRDVLMRDPSVTAETIAKSEGITVRAAQKRMQIGPAVDELLGRTKPTLDELEAGTKGIRAYLDDMLPGLSGHFEADKAHEIGVKAPDGYKWVDETLLGPLGKKAFRERGGWAKGFDSVNSAVTAATVYFKIGHLGTRALTNAATNIIQGSAAPVEIGRSVTLWHALSDSDKLRALAAAGQHGIASLPHEGTNWVARVATHGANWWAKHIDAPFRFNSIAYEARQAGFDTPAKFSKMLDVAQDPASEGVSAAEAAKADWVLKRANRAGIAYDRLNETEKAWLTRATWFYPWIKGATMFAGHVASEHPYKTLAGAQTGEMGRKNQLRTLGPVPTYEAGLIPFGGGEHPQTTDFSTFSPFSTPADLLNATARPGELSGFLNPVYGALDSLIHGTNQYGAKTTSPVTAALANLVSPTPESQIVTALLHKSGPTRMFHTTWESALARSLGGPATPRKVNKAALQSAFARERAGR